MGRNQSLAYERLVAIGKPILAPNQPGSKTVKNPDPDCFRPQNQRLRPQNPKQTRPQPPVERGWADKADRRPPLRGPGGWGGDWYLWHAPDGPRARAATGLGCMQAGTEKLGVIQASYASTIVAVLRNGPETTSQFSRNKLSSPPLGAKQGGGQHGRLCTGNRT